MAGHQRRCVGVGHSRAFNSKKVNVCRHTIKPRGVSHQPDTRFSGVHLDIVEPLPKSQGFQHILTCVDRFARLAEAIPITRMTAEQDALAFINTWVSRFGLPPTITADSGRPFESSFFRNLSRSVGVNHIHTMAYHAQAKRIVEKLHGQLKTALMAHPRIHDPGLKYYLWYISTCASPLVLTCSAPLQTWSTAPPCISLVSLLKQLRSLPSPIYGILPDICVYTWYDCDHLPQEPHNHVQYL